MRTCVQHDSDHTEVKFHLRFTSPIAALMVISLLRIAYLIQGRKAGITELIALQTLIISLLISTMSFS